LIGVQLGRGLRPAGAGEAVGAIGEIDHQIDDHHSAQRGGEEPPQLAQEQAVELAEWRLPSRHSRAAMSERSCMPSYEMREAAPYARARAWAGPAPDAATVSTRPPVVTTFPSCRRVPACRTQRSSLPSMPGRPR